MVSELLSSDWLLAAKIKHTCTYKLEAALEAVGAQSQPPPPPSSSSLPHGHRALPREECGRGRRQLDPSCAGQAALCQRDPVDPLPAGGVCGQCVGVLQRGDRARIHVLLPAVHFTVSDDCDIYHPSKNDDC